MRICYLCADPGIPIFGRKGCSTHVRETCTALTELGHDVRVLCANPGGDREGADPLDVIAIDAPRSRKLGFDLRHMLLDLRFQKRLDQVIREWRPDAIYERYSLYSRAGTLLARRHGLPRLLEVNAFLTREQRGRIRLGWLARAIERRIYRQAPRLIVVSEPLRKDVESLGIERQRIIKMPMAVNLEKFNPRISGEPVRARLGLDGRFVIGYVGTLAGWHGIVLMYDLARELQAAGAPPFRIVVVGGEPHKLDQHRRKVADAGLDDVLQFIGSVPYDQVPETIRAFDAALVPDTTYWSSPAKLFEYQACGVPVLAPSYPAIHEALNHGEEGFIFAPRDTAQMAAMALELMRDPERRRAMGDAARWRAERDHSWRHNGNEIMRLFNEIAEDAPTP